MEFLQIINFQWWEAFLQSLWFREPETESELGSKLAESFCIGTKDMKVWDKENNKNNNRTWY